MARSDDSEILRSFKEEGDRVREVAELSLRHARIVEAGKNYVIKDWVQGVRGDAWFAKWLSAGAKREDPAFRELMGIFQDLAKRVCTSRISRT